MRIGLSQAEFAALGGLGKQAQLNYEAGARSPDANYLAALMKVGVDVLYVISGARSDPAAMPADEQDLLREFRELDSTGKATVLATAKNVRAGSRDAAPVLLVEELELLLGFRQLNDVGQTAVQASLNGFLLSGTMTNSGEPAKRIPRLAENRVAKLDEAAREALEAAQADAQRSKRGRSPQKRGANDQD
ncbi:immunity repressor [Burkholderia phage Mana]|uniref:Immunity repressor n=1 Tax=Burkholderia phage Mana TaxID=2767578 RepID=A0A873WDG1_9CAUD|nr:immunity repressor [Burkholderia phage Mana]QPB09430.1 immunity repressor [Burkholderia phage Mana]